MYVKWKTKFTASESKYLCSSSKYILFCLDIIVYFFVDDTWNIFGVIAIHIFPRWILHFVIVWNDYEVTAVVSSNQGNAFLLDLSSCFQSNTFSFVCCFTWIELDTIELHAFWVQVARLYLILIAIGRIQ